MLNTESKPSARSIARANASAAARRLDEAVGVIDHHKLVFY